MTQRTSIEWTRGDDGTHGMTANPVRARRLDTGKVGHHCVKISPGCANCYSGVWNGWRGNGVPFTAAGSTQVEMFLDEKVLASLLKIKKPCRVFLGDMTDLFGAWVPDEWLDRIFATMALTPHITYQVLTKRAERMRAYLQQVSDERDMQRWAGAACDLLGTPDALTVFDDLAWPLPNVWAGVSVENQATADDRIPHLLRTPAAVRFLSCEPLLGAIDIWRSHPGCSACGAKPPHGEWALCAGARPLVDWVIVGGESGPHARPMHPGWARSIRDRCQAAGVSYFFKQWGQWAPFDRVEDLKDLGSDRSPVCLVKPDGRVIRPYSYEDRPGQQMVRVGKKAAARALDGREWNEFPAATEAPAR